MRRTILSLFLLLATTAAFAGSRNESNPGDAGRKFEGAPHMILHPQRPLTAEDRAELRNKGVEVQSPLSGGRYLARVADTASIADDSRILSLEAMTAEHKILRSALRAASRGKTWADVTVIFHKDSSYDDARQSILAAGGALADVFETGFGPSRRVEARIAPSALNALAADDRVLAIGGRPPINMIHHNAAAAALSKANVLHAAPYNLSGEGQIVMVSELAPAEATHTEFQGRLIIGEGSGDPSHSTHVSGTVGAAGLRADAKGMAPKVQIHEFDVSGSVAKHLDILEDNAIKLHPIANNTSLGFPLGWCTECGGSKPVWNDEEEYYGAYEAGYGTPAYDDIALDQDVLLVFSAGNAGNLPTLSERGEHLHANSEGDPDETKVHCISMNGSGTDCPTTFCTGLCELAMHHVQAPFDTMTVTGAAKNVLAVGAVQTGATTEITSFSSRGPAKDGRIKPDIVARGRLVMSTYPGNTYRANSGTSMSAPVVSGIAALLGEQWQKTFGGRPTVTEMKAIILAGGQEIGQPGPDYTHGFGIIDAKASADLIIGDGGTRSQIANGTVTQGSTFERQVTVTAQQNLRILAAWPDPSVILLGNDSFSAKALVNDLDLRVIGPDGTTHRPYVLDKVNFTAPATRGVNTVDNAELVEIANAAPGVYRVIVNGTSVVDGPQDVVVVSNAKGVSLKPCNDSQEPNNSVDSAFGNISPNSSLSGGICEAGDVDFIKFVVTRFGPISATVTAGDTPLRATLTASNGQTATVDVPANSTRTVTIQYGTGNGHQGTHAPDCIVQILPSRSRDRGMRRTTSSHRVQRRSIRCESNEHSRFSQ